MSSRSRTKQSGDAIKSDMSNIFKQSAVISQE